MRRQGRDAVGVRVFLVDGRGGYRVRHPDAVRRRHHRARVEPPARGKNRAVYVCQAFPNPTATVLPLTLVTVVHILRSETASTVLCAVDEGAAPAAAPASWTLTYTALSHTSLYLFGYIQKRHLIQGQS